MSIYRNDCENHNEIGLCTQECADLVNLMMGDANFDPDYTYDPTGCRRPRDLPVLRARLDTVLKRVVVDEQHSPDCECGCMDRCYAGVVFKVSYMGPVLF